METLLLQVLCLRQVLCDISSPQSYWGKRIAVAHSCQVFW